MSAASFSSIQPFEEEPNINIFPAVPVFATTLLLILLLAGCSGNGPAKFCAVVSGNTGSSCGLSISPAPAFLYVTSTSNGGEILVFSVDHNTGTLTTSSLISGPSIASAITSAQNKFLYVSDSQEGTIHAFSIDQATGILTLVPGSPFSAQGQSFFSPLSLVAATSLYATGPNGLTGFTIASNGALATVVGSPYSGGFNGKAVLGQSTSSPVNYFLYATNPNDPDGSISSFQIVAPVSGILTPVPGNFVTGDLSGPESIVFDSAPSTPLVFVALTHARQIAAFSVDASTGSLTPVPGSAFAAGFAPSALALSAGQKYLYALDSSGGTISGYNIGSHGALTLLSGFPLVVGAQPKGLAITADDYVYVTLPGSDLIHGFSIGSENGSLTPVAGSPFLVTAPGLLSIVQIQTP